MVTTAMHARTNRSAGFSMVEILVGVTIALIGMVAMFQVMESAESRKRTTASGSDAQISGSIAMHNLERDLRMAGNGFGSSASLGCTVNAFDTVRGGTFTFPMVPILITDGAGGSSDQLTVLYGSSPTSAIGYNFVTSGTTLTTVKMDSTSTRGGLMRGDLVFVTNGANCGMVEITDNTNTDQLTINHSTGNYTTQSNAPAVARFNNPGGYLTTPGQVFNLGPRDVPRRNVWQILNNKTLVVSDDLHSTPASEIGDSIIDLQAEYGLDTTPTRDYLVDTWQSAVPANWTRVIALRVALLTRSGQYERERVTNTAPSWAGGAFVMANLDGSADSAPGNPNDWRHYRYRVYQVTIPLRNVIWGTMP